jgi:hypothetical protein
MGTPCTDSTDSTDTAPAVADIAAPLCLPPVRDGGQSDALSVKLVFTSAAGGAKPLEPESACLVELALA